MVHPLAGRSNTPLMDWRSAQHIHCSYPVTYVHMPANVLHVVRERMCCRTCLITT
jgi:hypothetical protein